MKRLGQTSVEFLVILSVTLIVFGIIFTMSQKSYTSSQKALNSVHARTTLKQIADAADFVYAQGEGAKTKIYVTIPQGIVMTEVTGSHALIQLNMGTGVQDLFESSDACLVGEIPTSQGSYWITLEYTGGCVSIGTKNIVVTPSSDFFEVAAEAAAVLQEINVSNAGETEVVVSLLVTGAIASWASLDFTQLSVQPSSLNSSTLTVDPPDSQAPGSYFGQIVITNSETAYVDITVLISQDQSLNLQPTTWVTTIPEGESRNQGWTACNNGDSILYSVTLSKSAGDAGDWLAFSGGTNLGDIGNGDCGYRDSTLTVPGGTAAGTYTGTITASDGATDSSTLSIDVIVDTTTTSTSTSTTSSTSTSSIIASTTSTTSTSTTSTTILTCQEACSGAGYGTWQCRTNCGGQYPVYEATGDADCGAKMCCCGV